MALDISRKNHDQIASWQRLSGYPGFKLLVKELNKIIEEADAVIYQIGTDNKAQFSTRDIAIVKRDNAMRIKELPDLMIKQLSGTGTTPPENPDAYGDQSEFKEGDFDDELQNDDF